MSNNDDDLDVENFDDTGFDDYSKKGTIGDLWRNNPMVKIGVILAGFAIVVGAIVLFGGKVEKPVESLVTAGSEVSQAPGTAEISSTMEQSIEERNIQNVEEAARTGESAMPIPTQPSKGALPLPVDEVSGEDPLERWRKMQEERIRQQEMLAQAKPPQPEQQKPVDTRTPAVNALSQSMVSQMQAILQNQALPEPQIKKITPVEFLVEKEEKRLSRLQQQQQAAAAMNPKIDEQVENIIVPAGTIEYGQLLLEANTDAPGPVMAQIVSGPLRGSRVIGSFTSTEEYITLNFSTLVMDGIDYPIQAVGIDPDSTLPGVITEIDRRYFRRVILPMAAEFVKGLAEAVSDSGTTSVYISDSNVTQSTEDKNSKQEVASGLEEAGDRLSEILEEEADATKPMLRVASGTPVGILFVAPVTDTNLASRN